MKVKFGIVGCGNFGNYHLDNLLKRDDIEVVALAAGNREKLLRTAKKVPGARLYSNHHELLDAEKELDALVVCVTPDGHDDIETCAAEHGVNLYVEKPVNLSLERAKEIAGCIEKTGVLCSVGYQTRYNPFMDEIKRRLGGIKPGLALGKFMGYLPGPDSWWVKKARSGGQAVEQSTHIFDAFRFLFGEAVSVYASGIRNMHPEKFAHDIEDASNVVVTFANGAVASVFSGCYFDWEFMPSDVGLLIYADKLKVNYDWDKSLTFVTQEKTEVFADKGPYHATAMGAFVEAVKNRDPSFIRSDYSDAVKTLELSLAANRSMETNEVIRIGL